MRAKIIVAVLVIFIFSGAMAIAVQHQGAKNIQLDSGQKGSVAFPHHLHQAAVGDCMACHAVFPQEAGIIKKMIARKTLTAKQVMNKSCLKCHRAKKKAGEKTGPTKCAQCHAK